VDVCDKTKRQTTAQIFYCSFLAVARTPTVKEPAIKLKFILLQFYFTFISVMWLAEGVLASLTLLAAVCTK